MTSPLVPEDMSQSGLVYIKPWLPRREYQVITRCVIHPRGEWNKSTEVADTCFTLGCPITLTDQIPFLDINIYYLDTSWVEAVSLLNH